MKVSPSENTFLVRPIGEEEVRQAMWELGPDKAPGPDGFPPFFFRHYWEIIGKQVVQAVKIAFHTKHISEEWNWTLITLVPKHPNASLPQHFRPISLCTTLYKVCARLLASRLRWVIPRLISVEQGAFIRGRSISDNVLITQEFMHDLHRASARHSLMAVKLDMERAYDRLSWAFVHRSLQEFGFDEQFIEWVVACIQRPAFSLIINGSPTEFFHSSVGVRQGCPLSPLLFILAVDDLSRALHQAQLNRWTAPVRTEGAGPSISHLLFADDCILMGQATSDNATSFDSIIQRYCQASGQKVNLQKSSICFSPKTPRSIREAITNLLGISTQTDRFTYLGIPMTGRRPCCADFTELERRVRKRIEGWQVTGLSMMARVTIIRSVLSSLPLYMLSNVAIPSTCLRRIERCFRDFLWASMQDGHGIHLLSWDKICMPIHEGGLGIHSLLERRSALMARHASRFLLEPHCLWSSVLRARYGGWPSGENIIPPRGCSSFWKEVCQYGDLIRQNMSWMIGDGSSIDVMKDSWISELPLSRWPSFISSEVPTDLRVKDLISPYSPTWHTHLVASFFGSDLSQRILSIPLISGPAVDVRLWQRSSLPRASLKDLMDLLRPELQNTKEAAWIWSLPILPRIQLFIWKLLWDCLPTSALLSHRGVPIQATCPLCGSETETTDHAIFTCPRARRIWYLLGYNCRMNGPNSPRSLFLQDLRTAPKHQCGLWAVTAYQIWLSRNQIIFTDDCISSRQIVWKIKALAADCARATQKVDPDFPGRWGSPAASAANRSTVYISWEPPPPGFVKINFDGSVRGRIAGSAFIIRGPQGDMLAAGGFGSLDSSVPRSELYGAWAGITYAAKFFRTHRLVIEGDSLTVIRWIRKENMPADPINPILRDIWLTLQEVVSVQIHHIFREANSAADWVATSVAQHSGHWVWRLGDPCPPVLAQILYSDVSGLIHTRLV